jgi:hypothetical protein
MASTPTALVSGVSGEGASSVVMTSFTLPANLLGQVFVFTAGGGPPSNVPTISGWTMHTSLDVGDARRVTMFHRVSGTDVTEGPTIDCAGQAQSFIQYAALHWDANTVITGTNGADGIVQALASGNIHSPSINATPTLDALAAFANVNNPTISAINIGFQANAGAVGTGFTELFNLNFGGGSNKGTIVQYKTTNDTVHELTGCTNSADMFIGMAVEIAHIAVATPPPTYDNAPRFDLQRAADNDEDVWSAMTDARSWF